MMLMMMIYIDIINGFMYCYPTSTNPWYPSCVYTLVHMFINIVLFQITNSNDWMYFIWPLDGTPGGTTATGQCWSGSNVYEGLLHIPQTTGQESHHQMQLSIISMTPYKRLWNRRKRVQNSVALLRSLSDKYTWERHELPYPPIYGLNITTNVLERSI